MTTPDSLTQLGTNFGGWSLDVTIELAHTCDEELDIFLEAPDGTMVELLTNVGGNGDNFTATRLEDETEQSIPTGESPCFVIFQQEGLLRDFHGKSITGTWLLHITDDTANGARGVLLHWSLDIELVPDPEGNLNFGGRVDATDIDMLFANLGSDDFTYDLDGAANSEDVNRLVLNIMGKRFYDVDLE